ncbi:hypothetical protein Tco_1036356, partial [Tanacetum coccineum]
DIIESVISCETAKDTWTDLVHSFEGPSDTKENKIMDLKLEYQTFKAKTSETLSQIYTHYKTLLNELSNDDVTLSKHEINVGFVNSLFEKWQSFPQGLRNANHTQTFDLADIYGRRPKVPKTNGSNSKLKIAKSVISNIMEPSTCRGSNTSVAPSSSSIDLKLSKLSWD